MDDLPIKHRPSCRLITVGWFSTGYYLEDRHFVQNGHESTVGVTLHDCEVLIDEQHSLKEITLSLFSLGHVAFNFMGRLCDRHVHAD